jgi:transposase
MVKLMSTGPSNNYPPELREWAIRMVGVVRTEYTSDWAAVCSMATKLGIGAPQTLMNGSARPKSTPGGVPG